MLMKKRTMFGILKYLPKVAIFALGAATAIAVQAIVSVSVKSHTKIKFAYWLEGDCLCVFVAWPYAEDDIRVDKKSKYHCIKSKIAS